MAITLFPDRSSWGLLYCRFHVRVTLTTCCVADAGLVAALFLCAWTPWRTWSTTVPTATDTWGPTTGSTKHITSSDCIVIIVIQVIPHRWAWLLHAHLTSALQSYESVNHKSSVRRQKGLTGYCFKYIDRHFCLQAYEINQGSQPGSLIPMKHAQCFQFCFALLLQLFLWINWIFPVELLA